MKVAVEDSPVCSGAGHSGLRSRAMSDVGTVVLRLPAFEHPEQGSRDNATRTADAQDATRELTALNQVVTFRPREPQCPGSFGHAPGSAPGGTDTRGAIQGVWWFIALPMHLGFFILFKTALLRADDLLWTCGNHEALMHEADLRSAESWAGDSSEQQVP